MHVPPPVPVPRSAATALLALTLVVLTLPAAPLAGCGAASAGAPESPAAPAPAPEAEGGGEGGGRLALVALHPAEAPVSTGLVVRVEARGLRPGGRGPLPLALVGRRAGLLKVEGPQSALLDVPPGEAPGPVDVVLVVGDEAARLEAGFRYVTDPPSIASLAPPAGGHVEGVGGTVVTIQTRGFPPLLAPRVTFDDVPAPAVSVAGPGTLRAEVPPLSGDGPHARVVVSVGDASAEALLARARPPRPGDLVLNEALANPGGLDANGDGALQSAGDEFVEVVSVAASPLLLTGAALRDATAQRHVFPEPTLLLPGAALVVFGFGNPRGFPPAPLSGAAQVASTGSLGLNNGAETVRLVAADGTTELFSLSWSAAASRAGVSRNLLPDGAAVASPVGDEGTAPHTEASGAALPASPGRRADGRPFP